MDDTAIGKIVLYALGSAIIGICAAYRGRAHARRLAAGDPHGLEALPRVRVPTEGADPAQDAILAAAARDAACSGGWMAAARVYSRAERGTRGARRRYLRAHYVALLRAHCREQGRLATWLLLLGAAIIIGILIAGRLWP